MAVPKYDEMFNALLKALFDLGGSASIQEMEEKVAEILNLSDEDLEEKHRGNRTSFNYRLAWTRNYLKRYGLLENSSRGVWSLTPEGLKNRTVDKDAVNRKVKKLDVQKLPDDEHIDNSGEVYITWKDELLNILKSLKPEEFERLCQRVLREAGFVQVVITGKSGDGGIDGTGLVKVAGFLTFKVIFQCKRYQGTVSSQQIREFKGTMVGRADKGLFITTGSFTRDARAEATRDGSTPIDLVDGEGLVEKMKELKLGIKIMTEETVKVTPQWFENF